MTWSFKILLCLLSVILTGESVSASFYTQHEQGWFWYKEDPKKERSEKRGRRQRLSDPPSKVLTYREKVKKVQEEFEEATAQAVLAPTLENTRRTLRLQKLIEERASRFQEMWMLASLMEGHLERVEDKDAPLHRKILKEEKTKNIKQKIRGLARETGLFFAFRKDCRYCHAFAPQVRAFAQEYGFEVKAVSAEGGTLNDFPDASQDNGILQKINPRGVYPALFLAHPASGQVVPLAWGMVTPDQLLENISTLLPFLERSAIDAR